MPVTHGVTGSSPVRTASLTERRKEIKWVSLNKSRIKFGALVQLVRIHACHAWGHGFESRTHRKGEWFFHSPFLLSPFKVLSNVKSNRICLKTLWVYYANSGFASVLSLRQPRCNYASMQSTITDGRKFSDRRPVLLTDANAIEESLSAFWKTQQVACWFTSFNG